MFWIKFVGIILAFVIFKLWGNSYSNWHGECDNKEFYKEDKLKRPLWSVILLFIIALIPVANIILTVAVLVVYSYLLSEGDIFFHSNSKKFKWLNREI